MSQVNILGRLPTDVQLRHKTLTLQVDTTGV